jgi:hypothetical protein
MSYPKALSYRLMITCISLLCIPIGTSWACGGFFCNSSQPVNQNAERILFAAQEGQIEMHVQIQYQGPPVGFGWILPVAPGVETEVSSEALFIALDRLYTPNFNLSYEYDESCNNPDEVQYDSNEESGNFRGQDSGLPPEAPEPTVQVISREPVGPYDRAILQADNIDVLREWLNENEYQIPEAIDEKLSPYIEGGAVFVVIKLLADSDAGDLVPLKLTFPGDSPTIPILPTAVSAEPDMGMIVHILGAYRAIPSNYQHVVINEAAINWEARGNNYADVVSQAADEAGGQAFTTDYAGEVGESIINVMQPYSDQVLADLAAATTFGEIQNIIPDRTNPDYQRIFTSIYGEQDQDWDLPADGLILSEALIEQFNSVYSSLNELLVTSTKMTRLYTTMSASEMNNDPMFSFNSDLEDIDQFHNATIYITCDDNYDVAERVIELSDGRRYAVEAATPIERQEGETVRGEDQPAAIRIERMFAAGQPEVIREVAPEEATPENGSLNTMNNGEGPSRELCRLLPVACNENTDQPSFGDNGENSSAAGGGSSSGCDQSAQTQHTLLLGLLMMIMIWRRKASAC